VILRSYAEEHSERIALWEDEQGFDLLTDWASTTQQSLRSAGYSAVGVCLGGSLVHLTASTPDGESEDFLFSLDKRGYGVLRTGTPSAAPALQKNALHEFACVMPPRRSAALEAPCG
jgi:hypothetical protein